MAADAQSQAPPRGRPWQLSLGFALWFTALVFFLFMAVMAAFYDYFPADLRIAHAIQDIDVPAFGGYVDFMNFVGDEKVYVVLTVLAIGAFARARAGWEAILLALTIVPPAIESAMKSWVGRPRPSADLLHIDGHYSGASFPSGHVVGMAALFGALFFLVPAVVPWRPVRWVLQAGCLLLVASAGPARVYVGAHWPSDVLGSLLLAFVVLAPLLVGYGWLRRGPRPAPERPRAG